MAVRTILARSVGLALAATSGSALADQFDYSLYMSLEHSDNITLSTSAPISQNVIIPGVNFAYTQQGSTIQATATGNIEYRDYPGNTFGNQTVGDLSAQANWTVVPQRLDVFVQDYAGVQPVDTLAPNAPSNQQQTNVLAVGPTLHFRVGEAMAGQVELHYINSYASKLAEFNSSRGDAAFRLFRDINPTDQVSFNAEYQHVTFSDVTAGPNYDRYEVYGSYATRLTHFDANLTAGWTNIDYSGSGPHLSDPLARVTVGWRPSAQSTFTLSGAYQYVDAAQSILQPSSVQIGTDVVPLQPVAQVLSDVRGGINTGSAIISSDVYKERRLAATYNYRDERLTLTVAPAYDKLDYVNDTQLNQSDRGVSFTASYKLRPTVTLSGFTTVDRFVYDNINRTDKDYRFGIDFGHQWTPHWSWHASYVRQIRNSDAAGQSYHENEYLLTVVFTR
ncbi:outer membrane beta-barrel protein [Dyella humicola]|uniref:outer membrane beta-barrel protein n=1 Tax=Dyella humicola TaxID=2992126 RepID=UPI002252806C|nr:outer membrane beta-barrel protein [Dyella humicola]